MRRARPVVILALVVLAGCTGPVSEWPSNDPLEGVLGDEGEDAGLSEVEGYGVDDTLGIEDPTLSSEADLRAVTYRAMARVEVIRGQDFEANVSIEVVDRETYREETTWAPGEADAFTNEAWRAAFAVDGETDYNDALESVYGESVHGYYQNGEIVLVVGDPETPRVNRDTLVHELAHALQDQRGALTREGETVDERTAEQGLLEGEANYVATLYDERCGQEWACLEGPPEPASDLGDGSFENPLFGSVFAPYAEGPAFVSHRHETGGWTAVDAAFEDRPASSEQLLHPEHYPEEGPIDASVVDRSSDAWEPFADDGAVRTETMGEATLFASLYAAGVIDRSITEGGTDRSPYNYTHPATAGWAGDTLVAYSNLDSATDGGEPARTGHVWRLAWDSPDDAAQFRDAYLDLLEAHGGDRIGTYTYRIPDGEAFDGAYRVSLEGETVTIVGGPDRESLAAIHEPVCVGEGAALEAGFAAPVPVASG